jgi:hypothetical protein
MKMNKMGIYFRKNVGSFLNTLLGRTTKFEQTESDLYNGVKLAENVDLDKQVKKTLLEVESKKSQAIELIHKLQNC